MNEPNELIKEKSPYLLQHAYNPVNWYAWNDEAFKLAEKEDKPIFVSIGYSTCHWCHVMAHESFENNEIANYLNDNFVSIKVDREERPDVDSIYMSVCQALTGSGGWPLSVFIDSKKKPIYAGTYFPIETFLQLLKNINNLWKNNRENLLSHSKTIIEHISIINKDIKEIDLKLVDEAFHLLEVNFDEAYGGFSSAPKFPTPHNLLFLLKYYQCTDNPKALDMVTVTLDSMRAGGIYDHIGYGFSRYSTDRKWLVPHFEKMLYDNALLIITYSECYRIFKRERFINTAIEIADYLLRVMRSIEGGFFTAEDADSEGEEGLFYVFTPDEIELILGEDSKIFCNYFNITKDGNFEGKSIPNLIGKSIREEDKDLVEKCREKVFSYQAKRERPYKDDKVLTSINGLAISAFSILGKVTNNKEYIEIAEDAVDFIKDKLFIDGQLMARYRDKESKFLGYAEDYSFLIMGLIDLYQVTFDNRFLNFALELNDIFINHFYDNDNGGFYLTDKDSEVILVRKKDIYDGATPSANSIQVNNLYRLSGITQDENLNKIADKTLEYFSNEISDYPAAYTFSIYNVLYQTYGATNITLTANDKNDLVDMLEVIKDSNIPFINILVVENNPTYKVVNNKPTAYVCKGFNCLPPVNDLEQLYEVLKK